MKVVELTVDNEKQYLDKIAELEELTLEVMKEEGREGQLFATGKDDISEYIHSNQNTVIVAVDEKGEVEGATYVTQGQEPFTYNDITKYFKQGKEYRQHVKSQYKDEPKYKKALLDIYKIKLEAFEYAKNRILREHPGVKSFQEFLKNEIQENGFHEKSELREKMNRYMSGYIINNFGKDIQEQYQQFYWISVEDISEEFDKTVCIQDENMQEYEEMLKQSKLTIYENPEFDISKYYSANTENAVELDTYITSPNSRSTGIARVIVFEGIKKHMERHFQDPKNKEIFLCSTLHRDNLSSKYVSEFFGLEDSLYVNRRQGRDREVHICRVPREKAIEYLSSISDKLAVLYKYNPNHKHISEGTVRRVLSEQLQYERKEYERLKNAKTCDRKFNGINLRFIESKRQKIGRLQQYLESIGRKEGEKEHEGK